MFSYSKRYVSAFPPRSPEKAKQKRRRRSSGGASCVSTSSTSTPPPGIVYPPPHHRGPPHVSKNRMATGGAGSSEEDGAAVTVITAGMPGLVAASSAETDETGSERFYTPCGTFVSECDSKDEVVGGSTAEPELQTQQQQQVDESVEDEEGKPGSVEGDGEDSTAAEGKATADAVAKKQPSFHKSSSFIRVADLDLHALRSEASDALMAQHDCLPAPPPPHVCPDPSDRDCWVGLDMVTSEGLSHSAYVPLVVGALVRAGLHAIGDEGMWTPADRATKRLVAERSGGGGRRPGPASPQTGTSVDKEVMVWTGTFPHRHYGHDLPAVRSRGVVAMSPSDLASLLLDSDRVGEYNKSSLGRTDEMVFGDNDLHSSSPLGVTKVTRSRAKVPLVSRALEFVSLLHGRRLVDGDGMGEGYVVVARAVVPSDECHPGGGGDEGVIRSEILMNVHLIRSLEAGDCGTSDKCEMINISHLKSPMVPMFVAKKLGLTAAVSFINDIRALC